MESITIPSSVTSLGLGAFGQCQKLKSVVVSEGITTLPQRCFRECKLLENVSLHSTLIKIEDYSFLMCYALKSIDLPNGLTFIGLQALADTPMASITIPQSVTTIGPAAFMQCKNLDNVVLPDNIKTIYHNIFNGCTSLKKYLYT